MRDELKQTEGGARYESPILVRIGTFESITQGNLGGASLDATFPPHTPFRDLTFSTP